MQVSFTRHMLHGSNTTLALCILMQVSLSEEDAQLFKRHYSKLMYQAILTATQKSLQVGLLLL